MIKYYHIYILTNWSNEIFYTGVTNDIARRVWEHRNDIVKGFTSKYKLRKLVYFETYENIGLAIEREKKIKEMAKKLEIQYNF